MKTRQDESVVAQIKQLSSTMRSNKSNLRNDILNLNEIIVHSELLIKRFDELEAQLSER